MLMTDLRELKAVLQIDPCNTAEDLALGFWIEQASRIIEDYLGRQGEIFKKSRTEYYNGTGTHKLLLKARPVFTTPTIEVWEDNRSHYDSQDTDFPENSELTYGEDFYLVVDQDDGTSRSGILIKRKSDWMDEGVRERGYLSPYRVTTHGTIKVTYTAGYTIDTLPSVFRLACNQLVAKLRLIFPLGVMAGSESYEDRSISYVKYRNDLTGLIKPLLFQYRNWKW